jgi:hypothetical protein
MRPRGKARRTRIPGVFERGATPPPRMHRPSNAARLSPRAAKGPSGNNCVISGRRGARLARREERAYRVYVSDEQSAFAKLRRDLAEARSLSSPGGGGRSPAGCIGGQNGAVISGRALRTRGRPLRVQTERRRHGVGHREGVGPMRFRTSVTNCSRSSSRWSTTSRTIDKSTSS